MAAIRLADLSLDHEQQAVDRRHLDQGPQHERSGQVVRQIGHEGPRTSPPLIEEPGHIEHHGIRFDHLDPDRFDDASQDRQQMAIQLDGHHPGPGFGQRQGQRAQTGPELDDGRPRPDLSQAGDAPDRVRIGDEVLPEGTTRAEPMFGQQRRDARSGMGHQEIVTFTTP